MLSSWKMIFLLIIFAIGNFFPNALGTVIGSGLNNVELAWHNMNEATELYGLMFGVMFFNALAANLGMQIVRNENAVFKQSILLLAIPSLWVWHMFYGDKKDAFSWFKFLSQATLVTAVILYMIWDREALEQ